MSTLDGSAPGISYQASLPLDWQSAADPPASGTAQWRQSNIALLQALATLEAAAPEKEAAESEPATQKAIERLEAKLDVALALLARLLEEHARLPARSPVTLGVRSIAWQARQETPAPGTLLQIQLYLSPRLPQPLRFLARVGTVEGKLCRAELLEMDAEQEEWLTRTLFRYHRRALQARHHG